jgi:hypothetical protein
MAKRGGFGANRQLPTLPGPVLTTATIKSLYPCHIKDEWSNNPKAPLANYMLANGMGSGGLATGSSSFKFEHGVIDGQTVYR